MKGEKITFIVLGLILIIGFSYYQLKDETLSLPFGNPFNKKSADFKEFYIDVSEGDTEVEKTVIIKYNNVLVEAEKIYNKRLSGKEVATKETRLYETIYNDFFSYLRNNETNIQDKLWQNIQTKMEAFVKYSESLPLDNNVDIKDKNSKETRSEKREKIDNSSKTGITPIDIVDIGKTNNSQEIEVDLNDYLGFHGDETDWNYTEFDDETVEYLKDMGVYYSRKLNSWVRVKK